MSLRSCYCYLLSTNTKARDTRSLDEMTNVALVNVIVKTSVTTQPTPTTSGPAEDDSKEKLYFILMIVFVSLFGVLLLIVLCTPLILKFCR